MFNQPLNQPVRKGKTYIVVTNDLEMDQRIHRTALTLMEAGIQPVLVGRLLPGSRKITDRPYGVKRLRLLFRKGFFFYACYNFRLFLFLLVRRTDLLVANDLDTLPACWLVSRLKGTRLVYDSHEYFTELPELVGRDFIRGIWTWIERKTLPGIKHSYTVCGSISRAYHEKYGISMAVVRNLPLEEKMEARRPDLLFCNPKRVIIYQGTLNVGRGLEQMIQAMQYLENFRFKIFGAGPTQDELQALRDHMGLMERVEFMGRIPFRELKHHTRQASLGISLEDNIGLNYYYALPNKLFDYIQARIPVLVSDLPEMRAVVEAYDIGEILTSRDPEKLAVQVDTMMSDQERRMVWKKNLSRAAGELSWEKEVDQLRDVYRGAGLTFP